MPVGSFSRACICSSEHSPSRPNNRRLPCVPQRNKASTSRRSAPWVRATCATRSKVRASAWTRATARRTRTAASSAARATAATRTVAGRCPRSSGRRWSQSPCSWPGSPGPREPPAPDSRRPAPGAHLLAPRPGRLAPRHSSAVPRDCRPRSPATLGGREVPELGGWSRGFAPFPSRTTGVCRRSGPGQVARGCADPRGRAGQLVRRGFLNGTNEARE